MICSINNAPVKSINERKMEGIFVKTLPRCTSLVPQLIHSSTHSFQMRFANWRGNKLANKTPVDDSLQAKIQIVYRL